METDFVKDNKNLSSVIYSTYCTVYIGKATCVCVIQGAFVVFCGLPFIFLCGTVGRKTYVFGNGWPHQLQRLVTFRLSKIWQYGAEWKEII